MVHLFTLIDSPYWREQGGPSIGEAVALARPLGHHPSVDAVGPATPWSSRLVSPVAAMFNDAMTPACRECGAPLPGSLGNDCRAHLHAVLALEAQIPGGPGMMAHYLAVTAYNLQHPAAFTPEARRHMLDGLAGALAGELTVEALRRRARRSYDGPVRVLRERGVGPGDANNEPVAGWPVEWSVTVMHALGAELDPESYYSRVREWAEAVVETIGATAVGE